MNINNEFYSTNYWEERYRSNGTSGYGSYGRLAEFKANVINRFVLEKNIASVIDFGCGDGNQLSMFYVSKYIGVDVSKFVIEKCKNNFNSDPGKFFYTISEFIESPIKAELTLSLDVIYHLVEDDIFAGYMHMLFSASKRFCIIYSCNEECIKTDSQHVRRRKFTDWVKNNLQDWFLSKIVHNVYPHDGTRNSEVTSFSDFYIYYLSSSE